MTSTDEIAEAERREAEHAMAATELIRAGSLIDAQERLAAAVEARALVVKLKAKQEKRGPFGLREENGEVRFGMLSVRIRTDGCIVLGASGAVIYSTPNLEAELVHLCDAILSARGMIAVKAEVTDEELNEEAHRYVERKYPECFYQEKARIQAAYLAGARRSGK
jgi:hypothetical protein